MMVIMSAQIISYQSRPGSRLRKNLLQQPLNWDRPPCILCAGCEKPIEIGEQCEKRGGHNRNRTKYYHKRCWRGMQI